MKEVMLIIHFIGLSMGLGTSFAMMFLGIASSKLEPTEARNFMKNASSLSRMGHIGLALLIASGIGLIIPHMEILSTTPMLLAKLVLVVVLGGLVGMAGAASKKALKGGSPEQGKKAALFGRLSLITALVIVVLAVYVFH